MFLKQFFAKISGNNTDTGSNVLDSIIRSIPDFHILEQESEMSKIDHFKYLCNHSPLWFYVLLEAQILAQGKKLGPLGSRIIAEVLVQVLKADKCSILNNADWPPKIFDEIELKTTGNSVEGDHSMIKFLKYAGVYG